MVQFRLRLLDLIWTLCPPPIQAARARSVTKNQMFSRYRPLQNTRNTLEVLAGAISWGFKSPSPHHIINRLQRKSHLQGWLSLFCSLLCSLSVGFPRCRRSPDSPLFFRPSIHLDPHLLDVAKVDDVVPMQHLMCLMSADLHRSRLRDASFLDHVSNGATPQVVKKQPFVASPLDCGTPRGIEGLDRVSRLSSSAAPTTAGFRNNFGVLWKPEKHMIGPREVLIPEF